MRFEKLHVDVATGGASPPRRLLALVVSRDAREGDAQNGAAGGINRRRFRDVMVYLHGFPDMAVHPTKLDTASRLPSKLAEAWVEHGEKQPTCGGGDGGVALLAFNFGGVPGSDAELAFYDKTISQEVEDAVAVCEFARETLLESASDGRIHVVGISTGAILGCLLRGKQGVADTISVIAGLADLQRGIRYDFTDAQIQQFDEHGACWKEFYLPDGCALPANAIVSLDGASPATADELAAPPRKVFLRLHRRYYDECATPSSSSSGLDVARAVATLSDAASPLLVIHGDADANVPFADGEQLFAAASEPKRFLAVARGNHLLTNSKHLKKALQAILAHCASATTSRQR